MNATPNKTKMLWIIAGGVGIVLLLVVIIVAVLAANNTQQDNSSQTGQSGSGQNTEVVASETEVKQDLDDLDKRMRELKTEQDAAKASSNDSKKQIKVGS